MGDYKRKVQSADKSLLNLTSARNVHVDGGAALVAPVALGTGCRLLRVVNNTKGLSLNIRTGSRVIAIIGTGALEGTYDYGIYCDNGIQIDVGGSGSATVVFGD